MININQIYKVTNNRYTPNTNIPTQTLKINLKTIYIIQTQKIKNTKERHKYKYKSNDKHKYLQGVSKKRYFLGFLSYFSSGGRILLFRMCFGIRISSPFHLATQTIHF